MLSETETPADPESDTREFKTTIDDIAHWAGMPVEKCRDVINHFSTQRRIEVFPDRIVVRNINDFARFVSTKRR